MPDYMVPSVFVILEELPTTPSGKIQKFQLRQRFAEAEQTTGTKGARA